MLLCRRLYTVTQGLLGPLHRVCCTALLVFGVLCCTAWYRALHCTMCAVLHCTCGQWAVEALQCTAILLVGRGRWNSCNCPPHCLRAVGSRTPTMHCQTAQGQWAVELLQCAASLPGGSGQCNSCNALPHCVGAVGSGTPAIHWLTALGQWAVELLQCTASLPGCSGQWNSCCAVPHCLGARGNATRAMHCYTAWGQCGTLAMHDLTAQGQWAVELLICTATLPGLSGVGVLQCTASLLGGSRHWHSCTALPHCLGTMGSGTSAMHRHIARRQWAMQHLQCTAALPGGTR